MPGATPTAAAALRAASGDGDGQTRQQRAARVAAVCGKRGCHVRDSLAAASGMNPTPVTYVTTPETSEVRWQRARSPLRRQPHPHSATPATKHSTAPSSYKTTPQHEAATRATRCCLVCPSPSPRSGPKGRGGGGQMRQQRVARGRLSLRRRQEPLFRLLVSAGNEPMPTSPGAIASPRT